MTHFFAQTHLQLFDQLQRAGYSEADQILIARAYEFVSRLFTGTFRGSGKPFLAHLVGTASILLSLQQPISVIAAGLIHAVYEQGEFGDGSRGISPRKRSQVQQIVGKEIESLTAQYFALKWSDATITEIDLRLDRLSESEREVLIIRLANELEDHLDLGVVYCANPEQNIAFIHHNRDRLVEMATRLELPNLSKALAQTMDAVLSAKIIPELVSSYHYSYRIATVSRLRRWKSRVASILW